MPVRSQRRSRPLSSRDQQGLVRFSTEMRKQAPKFYCFPMPSFFWNFWYAVRCSERRRYRGLRGKRRCRCRLRIVLCTGSRIRKKKVRVCETITFLSVYCDINVIVIVINYINDFFKFNYKYVVIWTFNCLIYCIITYFINCSISFWLNFIGCWVKPAGKKCDFIVNFEPTLF